MCIYVALGNSLRDFWSNGRLLTNTLFSLGHVIRGAGSLVLGQEQDRVAGGFYSLQSFVGGMTGVNIWDRVIHHREIARMSKSCLTGEGNVYKWSDFKPHIKGGVQLVSRSCAI